MARAPLPTGPSPPEKSTLPGGDPFSLRVSSFTSPRVRLETPKGREPAAPLFRFRDRERTADTVRRVTSPPKRRRQGRRRCSHASVIVTCTSSTVPMLPAFARPARLLWQGCPRIAQSERRRIDPEGPARGRLQRRPHPLFPPRTLTRPRSGAGALRNTSRRLVRRSPSSEKPARDPSIAYVTGPAPRGRVLETNLEEE